MVVSNAKYEFIFADIGTNGRVSDAGVSANCKLKELFDGNNFHLPDLHPSKYLTEAPICAVRRRCLSADTLHDETLSIPKSKRPTKNLFLSTVKSTTSDYKCVWHINK